MAKYKTKKWKKSMTVNEDQQINYGLPKSYITPKLIKEQEEYEKNVKALEKSYDRKALWFAISLCVLALAALIYGYFQYQLLGELFKTGDIESSAAVKANWLMMGAFAASLLLYILVMPVVDAFDSRNRYGPKWEAIGYAPNSYNYLTNPFERVEDFELEEIDKNSFKAVGRGVTFIATKTLTENNRIHFEVGAQNDDPKFRHTSYNSAPMEVDTPLFIERQVGQLLDRMDETRAKNAEHEKFLQEYEARRAAKKAKRKVNV